MFKNFKISLVSTVVFLSLSLTMAQAATFTDVTGDNQFYPYIENLAVRGVFVPDSEGRFGPDTPVTRGEIAKYIVTAFAFENISDTNPFTDLSEESANYNQILTLYNLGIVSGYSDGTYREFDFVTRATATKYIVNSARIKNSEKFQKENPEQLFLDVANDNAFFTFVNGAASIQLFDESRIINGFSDKTFKPDNVINRAQAAKILSQTIKYVEEGGNFSPPTPVELPPRTIPDPIVDIGVIDEYPYSIYNIENGEIVPINGVEDPEITKHRELWAEILLIMPAEDSAQISKLIVFTDGRDNILAAVQRDLNDVSHFEFLIDVEDAYTDGVFDEEKTEYTLVHELGHIITLGTSQTDISPGLYTWTGISSDFDSLQAVERDNCANYYSFDSCTHPDSYLNLFFQRFWPIEDYLEILRIQKIEDVYTQYDEIYRFYSSRESRFVSMYAATNPEEDIAESFATFIFEDRPENSDTVANQKILFFYEFPELVQMREEIRSKVI